MGDDEMGIAVRSLLTAEMKGVSLRGRCYDSVVRSRCRAAIPFWGQADRRCTDVDCCPRDAACRRRSMNGAGCVALPGPEKDDRAVDRGAGCAAIHARDRDDYAFDHGVLLRIHATGGSCLGDDPVRAGVPDCARVCLAVARAETPSVVDRVSPPPSSA